MAGNLFENGSLISLGLIPLETCMVIELKKDSGYEDAYAQTREYIDWIEEMLQSKDRCIWHNMFE